MFFDSTYCLTGDKTNVLLIISARERFGQLGLVQYQQEFDPPLIRKLTSITWGCKQTKNKRFLSFTFIFLNIVNSVNQNVEKRNCYFAKKFTLILLSIPGELTGCLENIHRIHHLFAIFLCILFKKKKIKTRGQELRLAIFYIDLFFSFCRDHALTE